MARKEIADAARAASRRSARHAKKQRKPSYAVVRSADPLVAEVMHHPEVKLGRADLAMTQDMLQYDGQHSIAEGDTLMVCQMEDGRWAASDIVSSTVPPLYVEQGGTAELTTVAVDGPAPQQLSRQGPQQASQPRQIPQPGLFVAGVKVEPGNYAKTNATNTFTAAQNLGGNKITNLAAPTAATDALRQQELTTHEADTTAVHGIADTSALATNAGLAAHEADTTAVHGITDTSVLATAPVDPDELATTVAAPTGITQTGSVRRGKSIIATEQNTGSTTFTTLTTPDEVPNLVLPADGIIFVLFVGQVYESITGHMRYAIFLNNNEVKVPSHIAAAPVQGDSSMYSGTQGKWFAVATSPVYGLTHVDGTSGVSYTGDVTTGQIIGNRVNGGAICSIFAAAGTYTVGIRYKSIGATTVYAKNRKLWAWTMGF